MKLLAGVWGIVNNVPDYIKGVVALLAVGGTIFGGGVILADYKGMPERLDEVESRVHDNTERLDQILCVVLTEDIADPAMRYQCLFDPADALEGIPNAR